MVEYPHRHGQQAQLIRRNCDGDGHWTIRVNNSEYDPTCADWPDPPANSQAGTLYQVNSDSPHHGWPRTRVNKQTVYATAGITHRSFQKTNVRRTSHKNSASRGRKS